MAETGIDLLARCLLAGGVRRVWGLPLPGLGGLEVSDSGVARLLAEADGRLGPAPGFARLADGELWVSSRPGCAASPRSVGSADDLPSAIADALAAASGVVPAVAAVRCEFDLAAPVQPALRPMGPPEAPVSGSAVAGTDVHDGHPLVFAGPGVVRAGAVRGLRVWAEASGLGVSNSWGAKGVFDWRSPHHFGTVGLQARDFILGGFADAEMILACGIDLDETPRQRWGLVPVVEVDPGALGSKAPRRIGRGQADRLSAERPPLFAALAEVCQPLYASTAVPLMPPRAIADVANGLGSGDRVAADPGLAGLWVARAFPTSVAGSVVVPARQVAGFAAAAALVAACRQPAERVVAVTTAPVDSTTTQVVELARAHGIKIEVQAWGATTTSPDSMVTAVPVDFDITRRLIDVAGEVIAWQPSTDAPSEAG